jgi:hypothetical protein
MKENDHHELAIKSVACCSLICALDSCYKNCDGCRSGKGCGDNECYQKECCTTRGLYGSWECPDFPCGKGCFADTHPSQGQFVGCMRYIKEHEIKDYVAVIVRNQGKGLTYGLNGVYGEKSESEVLKLLKMA